MASASGDDPALRLRAELNRLIVFRVRLGLAVILGGLVLFAVADELLFRPVPTWLYGINAAGFLLVALFWVWLGRPSVRAHPVPYVLLGAMLICALRTLTGIWQDELAPTVILLSAVAMATATVLPWGAWPQLITAVIVAAAIFANAAVVLGGVDAVSVHLAGAAVTVLTLSVVVAVELERHRIRLAGDTLRRERAEAELARLNAELERRVQERTRQLEGTTRRLEREAQERLHAVQELRRSEAKLAALIDHTTDAIWAVDRDEQITVMNAVARTRFRERYGSDLDPAARARIPRDISDEFHGYYRRALADEHLHVERSYEEQGGLHHYLTAVHPIVDNGVITGATVFSKDITEHKRAEQQVREHQAELAHVLRVGTMGEMAAGLAHEINQPLGAIANYAQGSVRRLRDASIDGPGLLPIVEAIAAEALRAGEIIRRLRDLVRKDTAPQAAFDVGRLVRDSVRFVAGEAYAHGIAIRLELDPALPPVHGNAIQIEQVLLNLLLNAVEAVRAGGNGERRVVVVAAPVGGERVDVSVSDTGVGLPDPPVDVFEPFYTTKSAGLGMGLSISRSIIEAHGGRLWATRNPTHGSTFHFTLPVHGADTADEAAPKHQDDEAPLSPPSP
jgi:PAS domain S-box-containing protein